MKGKGMKGFLFFLYLVAVLGSVSIIQAEEYIIGAEDVLKISVWETPDLNVEVPVRPDGKISFPLIGDLQADGLTPLKLQKQIAEKLVRYIKDPIVTVIVVEIKSPKVYLQGQAKTPGTYILKKKTTLMGLLSDAGGVTPMADLERSYLKRDNKTVPVDFYKLLEEGDISQDKILIPGDIIFFPDNYEKRITVLGEVISPQVLNFRKGFTVLDAILTVGGLTPHADPDDTTVIRKEAESIREIEVDMEAVIEDGDVKQNILLMPGDTIIVGESWF